MKNKFLALFSIVFVAIGIISFKNTGTQDTTYTTTYTQYLNDFKTSQQALLQYIDAATVTSITDIEKIKTQIVLTRKKLKALDIWLRYLEPVAYKKINGSLPVEWETEVFEKFEKPYKREGAGLTLAALYLDEKNISKDSLRSLIKLCIAATETYSADSITKELNTYHHFFLCNRLFLLNLASIYTTGFECPDTALIIPELRDMMANVNNIYIAFNKSYPVTPFTQEYTDLYRRAIVFVNTQSSDYTKFDHFSFIRNYINPLFAMNQKMVLQYHVVSHSMVDYSLSKQSTSIFSKSVYRGQNSKGIYLRVDDTAVLAEIDRLGKLLFYDPILSGNNLRSCASCHNPKQYFTDTVATASLQFDHQNFLPRNTPSLINAPYNHLIMLDGKHLSLQDQTKAVITSPVEMGSDEKDIVAKVLSCKEYSKAFEKLLQYTPQEKEITFEHIASAITFYYSKFSRFYAPFDDAINNSKPLEPLAQKGFNLFMSKAQCGTCHFVPQFNGVKPPFVSSEFEVLGVPRDTAFKQLSPDKGRYSINPAYETMNAFRTGSLRNSAHTMPYMHNGVFTTMEQVIDFYDAGGGAGHGLKVDNQTLSSDSLKLTKVEKKQLLAFIASLNERIVPEAPPEKLPASKNKELNTRKVGGTY